MARVKRRYSKLRSRTKFHSKRKEAVESLRSTVLSPNSWLPTSSDSLCRQRWCFCSWRSALGDLGKALKCLLAAVACLCWWGQRTIAQVFHITASTTCPPHVYGQELKELRDEVRKLEQELEKLKSIVQNGGMGASVENPPCQTFKNIFSASPVHPLVVPAPLPPPPPPPPPLPPPPPPPATLCFKKRDIAKPVAVKKDVALQITLQDLLTVKLRKTCHNPGLEKVSPSERHKVLVTLKDLQSIRPQSKAPHLPPQVTNRFINPSRAGLDFQKHLKKVAIKRSPGGTPLTRKENIETGTGLTPIMTRALRRKFQLAHPESPSPRCFPTRSSFEEQSEDI